MFSILIDRGVHNLPFFPFSLLSFYLDYMVLPKGIILICFLDDGFRCLLMILETWQLLMMVLEVENPTAKVDKQSHLAHTLFYSYRVAIIFLWLLCTKNYIWTTTFLEVLKDLFKYFRTLIVVLVWIFDDGYK